MSSYITRYHSTHTGGR